MIQIIIKLQHKLFGKPVWTEDFDGEMRKSRLKTTSDGIILVNGIYGWRRANADGTFDNGYMKNWWPV